MFTNTYKRIFRKDYKLNPFIGNYQYPPQGLSPTCTYSSPYIGSVDHSKVCDYFEVRKRQEEAQDRKIKQIFVELAKSKDEWVKVSIEHSSSRS